MRQCNLHISGASIVRFDDVVPRWGWDSQRAVSSYTRLPRSARAFGNDPRAYKTSEYENFTERDKARGIGPTAVGCVFAVHRSVVGLLGDGPRGMTPFS